MSQPRFRVFDKAYGSFQEQGCAEQVLPHLMPFPVVIACVALLLECQSPQGARDDIARIANSLERRITDQEARHILLDEIDRSIQAARAHRCDRSELDILTRHRQRCSSRLESLLACFRAGDQLWTYRTYATSDRRGGEYGFALIRDNRVIKHMGILIHDGWVEIIVQPAQPVSVNSSSPLP